MYRTIYSRCSDNAAGKRIPQVYSAISKEMKVTSGDNSRFIKFHSIFVWYKKVLENIDIQLSTKHRASYTMPWCPGAILGQNNWGRLDVSYLSLIHI